MWAGVFVAFGAALVHNPFASTQKAQAQTAVATKAQSGSETDGQKTFAFLEQALRSTNALASGYAVHDWTTVNHQFVPQTQLATKGQELEKEFGITNAKVTSQSVNNESYWQVDGRWPNSTNVRVVLTSLPGSSSATQNVDTAPQTILTITALGTVSGNSGNSGFAGQYDKIEHMVTRVNGTPQMSGYLTGHLTSEKNEAQSEQIARKALRAVGATQVQALKTQYETSLSGYAKKALTYIDTGGKRMNVQVAVHDDTYHHRTDVLVGTPIITTTY